MKALRSFLYISSAVLAILVLAGGDASATLQKSVSYSPSQLGFSQSQGYDRVSLPGCRFMESRGRPELPFMGTKFAIPKDKKVGGITISNLDSVEVSGSYYIFPAQPPTPLDFSSPDFVLPDSAAYSSSHRYPGYFAHPGYEGYFGDTRIASLSLFPLQYIPATGKLWLYSFDFSLVLEDAEDQSLGVERRTERQQDAFVAMTKKMVANPEDVELYGPYPQIIPPWEAWSYLIIVPDSLEDAFQPLRNWYMRLGINTLIFTTEEIIEMYPTAPDLQEAIRRFLRHCTKNDGTEYVLLGGWKGIVPCRYWYGVAPSAADLYYSALDGSWDLNNNGVYGDTMSVPDDTLREFRLIDYYPDVWVGRAQVYNRAQAELLVGKILDYEGDPPSDYAPDNFLLLGAYVSGTTSGGMAKDSTFSETAEWTTAYRLYDKKYRDLGGTEDVDGQIDKDNAMYELKRGYYLINHCGHGTWGKISVGPDEETYGDIEYVITNADLDTLYNGRKQGIFFSEACFSAPYMDYNNCFGAHWLLNPIGGGVAYLGNDRHGFYMPGAPGTHYTDLLDRLFFRSLFDDTLSDGVVGRALAGARMDYIPMAPAETLYQPPGMPWPCYWGYHTLCTLNLFGDPAMPVWLRAPQRLSASHPRYLLREDVEKPFVVEVSSDGQPVFDAAVCLLMEGANIYEVSYTDGQGKAEFDIRAYQEGRLFVTVSKSSFVPYADSCAVVSLSASGSQATGFNNGRRLSSLRQNRIGLLFSSDEQIYGSYSSDQGKSWATARRIDWGECPATATLSDEEEKPEVVYPHRNGLKYAHWAEQPPMPSYWDITQLFYQYPPLVGVSAPSFVIDREENIGYVAWQSLGYKGSPAVTRRYYLGHFDLNHPQNFSYSAFDSLQVGDKLSSEQQEMLCMAEYDHHHNPPPPPPPEPGPGVDVDNQGRVHISWEKNGEIYYCQWNGSSFSTIEDVSESPGVSSQNPSLDWCDPKVWIVWEEDGEVLCRQLIGGVPQEIDDVSQTPGFDSQSPVVEKGIVAWSEETPEGGRDILLKRYCPDFGWVDEGNISRSPQMSSSYPQLLSQLEGETSLRLYTSWTEYVGTYVIGFDSRKIDLECPEDDKLYLFNLGQEEPLPETVQRDGYISYGSLMFESIDYGSDALLYRLSDLDPEKEYRLEIIFYHQLGEEIRQRVQIDGAVDEEIEVPSENLMKMTKLLPDTCYADGEVMVSISGLSGELAVCPLFILHEYSSSEPGEPKRTITGVNLPQGFELSQNYPNPFNPTTAISYQVSATSGRRSAVSLKIYNILGREVRTLVDKERGAGTYKAVWDGRDEAGHQVASGIYFYRLEAGDLFLTKKMLLLR